MRFLGLIPARGGSKGIHRKNLALVAGKPLIAWTIEAALASRALDRVIVSTDDKEIADVSKELGAEVPFIRPAELATDDAPSLAVARHALDELSADNYWADSLALLQPTSPLRTAEDIVGGCQVMADTGADSVVAVKRLRDHPLLAVEVDGHGRLFHTGDRTPNRRQDMPALYTPNGALYLVRSELLRTARGWYGENCFAFIMDEASSLDVDTDWDLILASLILSREQ